MKIVECCKELLNDTNIEITDKYSGLGEGKIAYCTGEEVSGRWIEIKFCPFCGKKIELIE